MADNERYLGSFCPDHGFGVTVDEDGCCSGCGIQAFGDATDALYQQRAKLKALAKEWRTALDRSVSAKRCADDLERVLDALEDPNA